MAASNYKPSLALVLAHEGGFVNHPRDPGGATNRGVTQAVYDAYRKYYGLALRSVRQITDIEVAEIYEKNYWKLCRADSLPCGLDYAVFDFGVNSGVSRAIKYLQRLVGVEDDGVIGLMTLNAVDAKAKVNEEALIAQYCANRMAFLKSLGTFPTFGKGWTRRVVGYNTGVQANDTGVVDYATMMARKDKIYVMPASIGSLANEPTGKAVAPLAPENFPVAPEVTSVKSLKELMQANDDLAKRVDNG